jgi:CheY-like chemotaxis protein
VRVLVAGHDAGTAVNHAEASQLLAQGGWDVILADMVLPGGSGLALAEQALAGGTGAVLCTGHPEHMERLRERGIVYLAKPFTIGDLEAALAAARKAIR